MLAARALRVRDRLVQVLDAERPTVGLREVEQHDRRLAARGEPVELDRALGVAERELYVGRVCSASRRRRPPLASSCW
jgi:hypothetical protein